LFEPDEMLLMKTPWGRPSIRRYNEDIQDHVQFYARILALPVIALSVTREHKKIFRRRQSFERHSYASAMHMSGDEDGRGLNGCRVCESI